MFMYRYDLYQCIITNIKGTLLKSSNFKTAVLLIRDGSAAVLL